MTELQQELSHFLSLYLRRRWQQGHETVVMVTDILWEGIKFRFLRRKIFFLWSICLYLAAWLFIEFLDYFG